MEFRRAMDAIVRAPFTTLTSSTYTSTSIAMRRSTLAVLARHQHSSPSLLFARSVSTTAPAQAAAAARKPREEDVQEQSSTSTSTSTTTARKPLQSTAANQARIDQLLGEITADSNRGNSIRRPLITNITTPPRTISTIETGPQTPSHPKPRATGTSSIQDFLDQLGLTKTHSSTSDTSRSGPRRGVQVDRMALPQSAYRMSDGTLIDPSIMLTNFATAEGPDMAAPSFKIGPSLGRCVNVNAQKQMDLARAFRSLEVKCAVNNVRKDFNQTRFHERPGLRRKRLKQTRWQARFKAGFQAIVRRVEDMRRKGW